MAGPELDDAAAFVRTAEAALANGDIGPAYECARTAAEFAAKWMLRRQGSTAVTKEHNVAPQLVRAGLWPGGAQGRRLSQFLADATRGIYGVGEPLGRSDAERGIRTAKRLLELARRA